jgi:hypothetical protein
VNGNILNSEGVHVGRIEKPKFPSSLKLFATIGQFINGFYPDEIETRVGRDSD